MTQLAPESWQYREANKRALSLPSLSEALCELVAEGVPVMAGTADLQFSNGLNRFAEAHPDRFLQFGISEQNMVSAAAGLATTGVVPYVATFASFLALLCCEQIRMDVAYCNLPVRLIGHHTGISLGFYGTSHHATEDIAIMRALANMIVVSPADGAALKALIKESGTRPEPMYFRISRGHDPVVYKDASALRIGKAVMGPLGRDANIIACGMTVHGAHEAARLLAEEGLSVGVIDMHTIKPLDRAAVLAASEAAPLILTVEEHNILGGLGGAVAEVLSETPQSARLVRHGIDDTYSLIAPPTHLYKHYRLDGPGIRDRLLEALSGEGK